jgi:D-threo-aldose 1-dehydrogenase
MDGVGLYRMAISRVAVGRSGLETSSVSLGTAGIGNLFREVSDGEAAEALAASFDSGIRFFDTAPHYGLGLSERRLGDFTSGLSRDDVVVSTKVGRLIRENPGYDGGMDSQGFMVSNRLHRVLDYSYDAVMKSLEESLERLALDRVDIVFVHDPDDHEKEAMEGAFVALQKLREDGVIRSFGAGMNQSAMLQRFIDNTDLDVVMCAGRFSLLEQPALADLLPRAQAKNVSVVAAGVFNSGILATESPQPGARYNYAPAPAEILQRAKDLSEACQGNGYSLPQVAAQFPFLHPSISVVCLGARNGEQASRNAELFANDIPREFYEHLADEGLVSPDSLAY